MTPKALPYGRQGVRAPALTPMTAETEGRRRWMKPLLGFRHRRGQATTEVVLLFPVFMFFLFAFAKIFATLILVQKLEIASYYAARRWQLESHRNAEYEPDDAGPLHDDIERKVSEYIGFGGRADEYGQTTEKFLDLVRLTGSGAKLDITRTQVWNVVTITVKTGPPLGTGWMTSKMQGFTFEVTKYVPNRDRPIAFVLPGLQG